MKSRLRFLFIILIIFSCKKKEEVNPTIVKIPDVQFENWLIKNGIDSDGLNNGQIKIEDAEKATLLNLDHYQNAIGGAPEKRIQNLIGIDAFVNLDTLLCSNNDLKSLDCSKMPKLRRLDCYENKLTNLNVSKNLELTRLACAKNQLSILNISTNTKLREFSCNNNLLKTLDLTKNSNLEIIVCSFNSIQSLDFSNCSKIKFIQCSNNNLTYLKMGSNPFLQIKVCKDNPNLLFICVNEIKEWGWTKDEITQYKICN